MKDKEKQNSNSNLVNLINDLWDCKEENVNGIALELLKKGYRKLPEDSVVLSREDYNIIDHNIKNLETVCTKHEKEIDRLEERNEELEYALLDMVNQFCQMGKEGYLCHAFMSAEENAFDVLDINYGEKADDVFERFNKKWGR